MLFPKIYFNLVAPWFLVDDETSCEGTDAESTQPGPMDKVFFSVLDLTQQNFSLTQNFGKYGEKFKL